MKYFSTENEIWQSEWLFSGNEKREIPYTRMEALEAIASDASQYPESVQRELNSVEGYGAKAELSKEEIKFVNERIDFWKQQKEKEYSAGFNMQEASAKLKGDAWIDLRLKWKEYQDTESDILSEYKKRWDEYDKKLNENKINNEINKNEKLTEESKKVLNNKQHEEPSDKFKEGDYIQIETEYSFNNGAGDETHRSKAVYEIITKNNHNYLKPFISKYYKPENIEKKPGNASELSSLGISIINNNTNFTNSLLLKSFGTKDVKGNVEEKKAHIISYKNITKEIKRELLDSKKVVNTPQTEEKETINYSNKKIILDHVPEYIKEYYKKNNLKINNEKYTNNIYKMIKKISQIKFQDLQLSEHDKEALFPLIKNINKTGKTEAEIETEFKKYIINPKNKNNIEVFGSIYKKSLSKSFRGFKKTISPLDKKETEKNIFAIKNNLFPIMKPSKEINYILNPDTKQIYPGATQMMLQRDNNIYNRSDTGYAFNSNLSKNGAALNYKVSTEVIYKGIDGDGHKHFELLVPCSAITKKNKSENKIIAEEKYKKTIEEAKNNKNINKEAFDLIKKAALFEKKYGYPYYKDNCKKQSAIITENLVIPAVINKNDIKETISHDMKNYITCMFSKKPYEPSVNYTKEPYKSQLLNFVQNNPSQIIRLSNESYQNIKQQIIELKHNSNKNEIVNENTKQKGRHI